MVKLLITKIYNIFNSITLLILVFIYLFMLQILTKIIMKHIFHYLNQKVLSLPITTIKLYNQYYPPFVKTTKYLLLKFYYPFYYYKKKKSLLTLSF